MMMMIMLKSNFGSRFFFSLARIRRLPSARPGLRLVVLGLGRPRRLLEAASQIPLLPRLPPAGQRLTQAMSDNFTTNGKKDRNKLLATVRRALQPKHTLTDDQINQFTTDILTNRTQKDDVFEALGKRKQSHAEEKIRHLFKISRTLSAKQEQQQRKKETKGDWQKGAPKQSENNSKAQGALFAAGSVPLGANLRGSKPKAEESWHELEPQDEFRLAYQTTGKVAPKLVMEERTAEAQGWTFVTTSSALELISRYENAAHPIALVVPSPAPNQKNPRAPQDHRAQIDSAIRHYVNNNAVQTRPVTTMSSITVRNAKTKQKDPQRRTVTIINMHPSNQILPSHDASFNELPADQRPSSVPNLSFNRLPITEITVSIVKPMCEDLGIATWWKQMSDAPQKRVKAQLTNCIAKGKWQPDEPYILKNKKYKWRGDEIEEGRIMSVFKIPNEHVPTVLALSGREGLVIDKQRSRIDNDEQQNDEYAKIRLPLDLNLADILSRIDTLAPELKKATRGVIPTFKGYALRVVKSAEASITAVMNPKEAQILGPAMGLTATSQWVIKGVPHYATKSQIIHTLAQPANSSWPGWTVRPSKTLSAAKSGTTMWKVEAAQEPPLRTITLNNYLITIEAYNEAPAMSRGNRLAPLRIVPKRPQHEIAPGDIYDRDYAEDDEDDDEEARDGGNMDVDPPKHDDEMQQSPQQSHVSTQQQPPAANIQSEGSNAQADSEASLRALLQQQLQLIQTLQATIANLQQEMQRMRAANDSDL